MKKAPGFSIIELVIAISLSSFVLVGVATIAAQMARSQMEGIRSGTMTGWSVTSYTAMAKEIEDANVLAYPVNNNDAFDSILVCKNWSRDQTPAPGKLSAFDPRTGNPAEVSVVQYCLDTVTDAPNWLIRRIAVVGTGVACPAKPATALACNDTVPGGGTNTVVGFRVEKLNGAPIFQRVDSVGGVRVRFVVGNQAPTPNIPTPKFTPFDFKISMQKQFNSPND